MTEYAVGGATFLLPRLGAESFDDVRVGIVQTELWRGVSHRRVRAMSPPAGWQGDGHAAQAWERDAALSPSTEIPTGCRSPRLRNKPQVGRSVSGERVWRGGERLSDTSIWHERPVRAEGVRISRAAAECSPRQADRSERRRATPWRCSIGRSVLEP